MIDNRICGPKFNKKEAEIRQLKAELSRIDADKAQPSIFTKTQSIPIPEPLFTSYQPFYNPPKQSTYDQFFGLSHLHSTNPNIPPIPTIKSHSPKKPKPKVKISKASPKEDLQVQKTLLKQPLNLQRKTKLQLTNTITSILITKIVTHIQLQKKVHSPLLPNPVHLNKFFRLRVLVC